MNFDGMPLIELVLTVDALEAQCCWQPFRAVGFPSSRTLTVRLDACCESLSTGCKFLPVAKSMPIAPKLELNTIQKEENSHPGDSD
jgi:hypothetical protein